MRGIVRFFGTIAVLMSIVTAGAIFFESYLTTEIVEAKVVQLISVKGKFDSVERIVVTKNETFDNNDNYYQGKDKSAEIQSKLKKNKVYKFKVVGYKFREHVPLFFSKNRNIISIVE